MFGLGFQEILLIMIIALIVFGPKKLPEVARMLGRTVGELRRSLDDFKLDIDSANYPEPGPNEGKHLDETSHCKEEVSPETNKKSGPK